MKRRPRSALARVLGCLIVTDFLAMGFTAAKILGISWWWGFGLAYLLGVFVVTAAILIAVALERD